MSKILQLRGLRVSFLVLLLSLPAVSRAQSRQRNTIYVLDCTGSMSGYNGSPDIWAPTKKFLRSELEKEARENPGATVTVLPFQEKVLHPIRVNLNNIAWPNLERVLDGYTKNVTATNICDSWLEAERYIDQSCDNYIVLMTDGHDNIGGTANEANRTERLEGILHDFCGKYQNTKGFYVQLTQAASLPAGILEAIDVCDDLYKIDATGGIPSFGCASDETININTRDLPADITLGFSNSGTFATTLAYAENPYLKFSIKGGKISQGKLILHVESKFGDNIETLNKAIDAPTVKFDLMLSSEEVIITNPGLSVALHTTPLRTLELTGNEVKVDRVRPFLWIKGNPRDTLRWNLDAKFNDAAKADNSSAMFRIRSDKDLSQYAIQFNGEALPEDSIIVVRAGGEAVVDLIIPQDTDDTDFRLTLDEINVRNLDRIKGCHPQNAKIVLNGEVDTLMSLIEIICWCIIALIALSLIIWFGLIRSSKYPTFKRGIITVQKPYYGTVKAKGYRKIVFTPKARKQGFIDRLFKGAVLYHVNAAWPCDAEVTPSGKNNMRFRCPSGTLICSPQPLLTSGTTSIIMNTAAPASEIVININ